MVTNTVLGQGEICIHVELLGFFVHFFHELFLFISVTIGRMYGRCRTRFFEQIGHETMYSYSGNKHFFTKSCHHQTYQNHEQPPQTSQNSYFQSHFSVLKIGRIFLKKKMFEEYLTRGPIFIKKCF